MKFVQPSPELIAARHSRQQLGHVSLPPYDARVQWQSGDRTAEKHVLLCRAGRSRVHRGFQGDGERQLGLPRQV